MSATIRRGPQVSAGFDARCFMASAEPSWSDAITPLQLAGQMNICCLFAPKVYLSDVHIGDNPTFFRSYVARNRHSLYLRIRELAELGIVRLLLRDASGHSRASSILTRCDSFTDMLESWIAQDGNSAGVAVSSVADKMKYFSDIDRWATGAIVERYSYTDVKKLFISVVQDAHGSAGLTRALPELNSMPIEARSALGQTIEREWFTLGDIYRTLKTYNLTITGPLGRFHSLLNEVAYSKYSSASLSGIDLQSQSFEELLRAENVEEVESASEPPTLHSSPVESILERADDVLSGPDLAFLGILRPQEIAELRQGAADLFDLFELAADPEYMQAQSDLDTRLVRAVSKYWESVCDYLVRKHVGASLRPTRLGIFLGRSPRFLRAIAGPVARLAINVGTPAATGVIVPTDLQDAADRSLDAVVRDFSLRFLVVTETSEIRRLRSMLPDRSWISAGRPRIYLP